MKQSELKRRTPLSRGKKRRLSDEERAQSYDFKMSGWATPCAACAVVPFLRHHAHHVVYEQHCPDGRKWDTANALPICDDCHERHHNASRRIPLSALTESNLKFAREVLGEAADDYLRRRYA